MMTFDKRLYICDNQGKRFFGRGPMQLLRNVERLGSLNKAAAEMNLSYHKALNMISSAEKGFGLTLLCRRTGGRSGGGSSITEEARELMEKYSSFEKLASERVESAFLDVFGEPEVKE